METSCHSACLATIVCQSFDKPPDIKLTCYQTCTVQPLTIWGMWCLLTSGHVCAHAWMDAWNAQTRDRSCLYRRLSILSGNVLFSMQSTTSIRGLLLQWLSDLCLSMSRNDELLLMAFSLMISLSLSWGCCIRQCSVLGLTLYIYFFLYKLPFCFPGESFVPYCWWLHPV